MVLSLHHARRREKTPLPPTTPLPREGGGKRGWHDVHCSGLPERLEFCLLLIFVSSQDVEPSYVDWSGCSFHAPPLEVLQQAKFGKALPEETLKFLLKQQDRIQGG